MTAAPACAACGTEPSRVAARFCDACGAPIAPSERPAEYKQVTVLFADVVHSMRIAATVGAERLREIMTELLDRSTSVVKRYGGTVDKFTGDGIMAVFGAPVALEDHAIRACLAALDIQKESELLAAKVGHRDGVTLQLRIGLNSGQVIAGGIGSAPFGYTAVGEQVGMAQRMESVAPPGGVMLSESTARLVANTAMLGEPEMARIKGADEPVPARRLLAVSDHRPSRRTESALVGRAWELNAVTSLLDEAIDGRGCVVNIVGPAGIGKSRLVREVAAIAMGRGLPVFGTYCESHTRDIPFHVVARLFRSTTGADELTADAARARIRNRSPDLDREDLLLLADLLGIADPAVALPDIAPDARRRRLTALIIGAALGHREPAVYVIEDAHWIDGVSESMLADFLAVIPQVPSLMLITHRPEYRGALTRISGAQTLALRPLSDSQSSALMSELLGRDPSLDGLAAQVVTRAAGNPFFAEEMVRDLAERGVLHGRPGAYQLHGDVDEVDVPATLQATIGARIDRLSSTAKHTLHAAAVIGLRFDTDLLSGMVDDADMTTLIGAELVDQVRFTVPPEYAFRHPLIRTVAYESQLKSDRAQLHRCLAAAIEQRDPGSADENAALIADHLEAAGDLHPAFAWHMRAATWLAFRDITAAHNSWRKAQDVADRLPEADQDRRSMRIAPRTLLCGTAYRLGIRHADTSFEELRELCTAAGDQRSLAIGMAGLSLWHGQLGSRREASRLATELVGLLESIDDPMLTVALSSPAMTAKQETGEIAEVLRLAQRVIDLAEGDPTRGNLIVVSPLSTAIAIRAYARWCFGIEGWRDDIRTAIETAQSAYIEPRLRSGIIWYTYILAIPNGVLPPDTTVLHETAETLASSEQSGDDLALYLARVARGVALVHRDGAERQAGLEMLTGLRRDVLEGRCMIHNTIPLVNMHIAKEYVRLGDLDGAIEMAQLIWRGLPSMSMEVPTPSR